MPGLKVQQTATRRERTASSSAENISSPATPSPRRPALPSLPQSEPANLPTRHGSSLSAVSSKARQARSVTNSPHKRVQNGTKSSSKEKSVPSDDSDAEDDDSDHSHVEDDNSNITGDKLRAETPCPTCRRIGRGLSAESQSSSRSPSPDDLFDSIESDSDTTLGMSTLSLGSAADSPVPSIDFQRKNAGPLQRSLIDIKVFHTILPEALDEQKVQREKDGYVYILEDKDQPGYVKIGMTTKHPHDRSTQIQRCKVVRPELVQGQDFTLVTCYKRLEKIIFADFWNERQCFLCECGKRHREWFKMSKEEAVLRVKLWQKWMQGEPYNPQGVLKPKWQKRIEALERDPSYEETAKAEHASGQWWQTFMK